MSLKGDKMRGSSYWSKQALKLNREVLLDWQVRLELMMERGSCTPRNSMEKFNQRGVQGQGKTIFIRGFDPSDGFDNIKSALEKHFGKCGEISRTSIPKDYEAGAPKGIAFVDFMDRNGVIQALQLDGSEVAGCRITVEEARRQKGDVCEGSGFGVRGWSHGSGSGGGWVRDGISASTSGRGNASIGGWGRENAFGSVRESGYGGSSGRISGFGSGSGSSWHREHTSGSSWHRECVSGSALHKESGYGSA